MITKTASWKSESNSDHNWFSLALSVCLLCCHCSWHIRIYLRNSSWWRSDRQRNHSICLSLWCTTTIKGGHHQDQSHIWPWRKHPSNWTSFDIYSTTYKYVLKSSCTGMTGCMVAQNPNKNYFLLSKPSTSCVWTKVHNTT